MNLTKLLKIKETYYYREVILYRGECKAVLTQVGHKAYAARLALEAKAGRKKKRPI